MLINLQDSCMKRFNDAKSSRPLEDLFNNQQASARFARESGLLAFADLPIVVALDCGFVAALGSLPLVALRLRIPFGLHRQRPDASLSDDPCSWSDLPRPDDCAIQT